jgi:hypothetical protein
MGYQFRVFLPSLSLNLMKQDIYSEKMQSNYFLFVFKKCKFNKFAFKENRDYPNSEIGHIRHKFLTKICPKRY